MRTFRAEVMIGSRRILKRPMLLQRERKVNFFAGEILFVESADGVERCASHEKKRSHAEPGREVDGAKGAEEKSRPKRQMTVHCQPCAPS